MGNLILVNGEEEFLMERAVADEIEASLIGDVSHFHLPDDLEDYLYSRQVPLMNGGNRAYVLWDVVDIPDLPENPKDVVICVGKNPKKPLVDNRAKRSHLFPALKTFNDNNDVIKWILKEGDRLNIDLSRVAPALFVNCGKSLRKISSEIEKMSVLTPRGAVVSPDEVKGVMCFSADLTPQPVVEAICDGNTARAIAFYDKLQEANDETGWVIAFLQRLTLQQLRLEKLFAKKHSDGEIADFLGVHPFVYKKTVLPRVGLWKQESLLNSINTLCELDIAHKSGDQFARFGLETEIIRLSEESKNVNRQR